MGDNCPKVIMTIPCAVKYHRPVVGKGYFFIPGERVAQTRSEILKSDPKVALSGPFFESLGRYNEDYPHILKCQARGTNHDVTWMAEDIGCKEHADSPIWSHLLMTVKLFLNWLEKHIQRKFRQSPGNFPLCKPSVLRVAPDKEFSHLDLIIRVG